MAVVKRKTLEEIVDAWLSVFCPTKVDFAASAPESSFAINFNADREMFLRDLRRLRPEARP